jgi:hypothetical protein
MCGSARRASLRCELRPVLNRNSDEAPNANYKLTVIVRGIVFALPLRWRGTVSRFS